MEYATRPSLSSNTAEGGGGMRKKALLQTRAIFTVCDTVQERAVNLRRRLKRIPEPRRISQ